MKVAMRTPATIMFVMLWAGVAGAQPSTPPEPAAKLQLDGAACRLAQPPPPPDPKNPQPSYESPARQQCEDELAKDAGWWFDLEARLRAKIHRQAAKEITTNNRHVVLAYGALWLVAIGFVLVMWRRQQALKVEIERLSRELKKAETS